MSTHRASLLAGLRTGGPRSVSTGAYNVPHTATVFPSATAQYLTGFGYEQEGNQFVTDSVGIPMTAPAKDATFSQFQRQQQAHPMLLQAQAQAQALQNAVVGGVPYGLQPAMTPDQQAFQLQLEVYKMQAMHQQQLQAQIFQEAQRQMLYQHQQQQLPSRRRPSEPITSGPLTTSFGQQLRNRTPPGANEGSATAGLDGRFPASKPGLNPHAHSFQSGINEMPSGNSAVSSNNWRNADRPNLPAPPVSGGNPATNGGTLLGASITAPPSARHTATTSWRRPTLVKAEDGELSASPPPTAGSPSASPPTVYVSTPEETSPTESQCESSPAHRARPQPLRFIVPPTIPDQVETDEVEGQVLPWARSNDAPSSPATPSSVSSVHSAAREEATRRLYEGLGLGRPNQPVAHAEPVRHVSQPARQPRGPPSGVEELGPRNFASRIRRKAIGGLGVLMDARGRRSSMIEVEAY